MHAKSGNLHAKVRERSPGVSRAGRSDLVPCRGAGRTAGFEAGGTRVCSLAGRLIQQHQFYQPNSTGSSYEITKTYRKT